MRLAWLALPLTLILVHADAPRQDADGLRERAKKLMTDGNWAEALGHYRTLLFEREPAKESGDDLQRLVQCLQQLGRVAEQDALVEAAIERCGANWRVLEAGALAYRDSSHDGWIIDGRFERQGQRSSGRWVISQARDRVRALQLLEKAIAQAADATTEEIDRLWSQTARAVLGPNGYGNAWKLQRLTDLSALPDYESDWSDWWRYGVGAPVDAAGLPILYEVAASFAAATSDGERYRFCLESSRRVNPAAANRTRTEWAGFLQSQFGLETVHGGFGWPTGPADEKGDLAAFDPESLGEDEALARLATGLRRFKLPDEHNPIRVYQQVIEEPLLGLAAPAAASLARIFENRRQLERAAEYWRRAIELGQSGNRRQLDQIIGAWGRFENGRPFATGRPPVLSFVFRNAGAVRFEARRIDLDRLLRDTTSYLESSPRSLDWKRFDVNDIGRRILENGEERYLKETVASWRMDLEAAKGHHDRMVPVTAPLDRAGTYLITATLDSGMVTRTIVQVADMAIVKKPIDGQSLFCAVDARSGEPIAGAEFSLFGYRQIQRDGGRYEVETKHLRATASDVGTIQVGKGSMEQHFNWLAVVAAPGREPAYLGFDGLWTRSADAGRMGDLKRVFAMTDRPVYRPGQKISAHIWIREVAFDQPALSPYADKSVRVAVQSPEGTKVLEQTLVTDEWAGTGFEMTLDDEARLGIYQILVDDVPVGHFRLEEYKKPEFEVTIEGPPESIRLGEKTKAVVTARYLFGGAVTKAEVHYTVTRTARSGSWYPSAPWDWCYGRGYWWWGSDLDRYPGFGLWGCRRPTYPWWGYSWEAPEVVADGTTEIGADGRLEIEIDTAPAKALHGRSDQEYRVVAEVRDASRRTVVGDGRVTVTRKPFDVSVWVDRGHYAPEDTMKVDLRAQRPNGDPIIGAALIRLLRVAVDASGSIRETEVARFEQRTGPEGSLGQEIRAAAPGQYRISALVTDEKGVTVEGGYLVVVRGLPTNKADFVFDDIELIPEKREYRPGETMKLLVGTDHLDGVVYLFLRSVNGTCTEPRVLRLDGKTTTVDLPIEKGDMPNFFIEAFTVVDGRVHQTIREVVVPPEKRVLDVAVNPEKERCLPGESTGLDVALRDSEGHPFKGTLVVAVYDRAVDSIAGESNVADIRAHFWKWRRYSNTMSATSLDRSFWTLQKRGEEGMEEIGLFGGLEALEKNAGTALKDGGFGAWSGRAPGGGRVRMPSSATAAPADSRALGFLGAPSEELEDADGVEGAAAPPVTIRRNFADTALWIGRLDTDAEGRAHARIDLPESLTTWRVRVWALGHGTVVGDGEAQLVSTKNLLLRLQTPRFMVEGDEATIAAIVMNRLEVEKEVRVDLASADLAGLRIEDGTRTVTIPVGGEARLDFRVKALREGELALTARAITDVESDGVEMKTPILVHGAMVTQARTGALDADQTAGEIEFDVPEQRRIDRSSLEARFSPSLAGAIIDCLPFLMEEPQGCTERTLNAFLPAVLVQKSLDDLGLDLAAIRDRRTNLDSQELGNGERRRERGRPYDAAAVFDRKTVEHLLKSGLDRLEQMQCEDGGWGWFSGYGERSMPHTTALVVGGLLALRDDDHAVPEAMLDRGLRWLATQQSARAEKIRRGPAEGVERHADDTDALVFAVLTAAGRRSEAMREYLVRDRVLLSNLSKAKLALAFHRRGEADQVAAFRRNLEQFLVRDEENGSAHLELPEGCLYWNWYGDELETQAAYLELLVAVEAPGEVARGLVKHLLHARRQAGAWRSTRDTASIVAAFNGYLRATKELDCDLDVTVSLDGRVLKKVHVDRSNLFDFDNRISLSGDAIETGTHRLRFEKSGRGALWFDAYRDVFSLEDRIPAAGLEIKVERRYWKLVPEIETVDQPGSRGELIDKKEARFKRLPLAEGDFLAIGQQVEVELIIEAKNDFEYVVIEDMKAAGLEPVELRSGYLPSGGLSPYVEMRDEKVAFWLTALPRGRHALTHRLRAETPGAFHALPCRAKAVYTPELNGNSDETLLGIRDAE